MGSDVDHPPGPALELRLGPFGGSPDVDETTGTLVAALVALALALFGVYQQSPFEIVLGVLLAAAAVVALTTRRTARLVLTPDGLLAVRDLPPRTVRSVRLDRLVSVRGRRWRPPLVRGERHGWTWLVLTPARGRPVSVHLGWWADEPALLAALAWWVGRTEASVDEAAARHLPPGPGPDTG
jgi:hypothetical protein